ncbi:hypothetical protein EV193_105183 [Herbihabitans rhizosphaerae]|uniref:Uncharacterized protein n=1 Tax=Herbihabitans rhizosphaerae TaxID=1872711 RepID=A0A4Q7KM60_9PSEU|nr:hypothetical protein [Herbihabitans rhizosphaerae]RZS37625.1 hypothetical protein EV193_105183 [Herbihabitans rhizosphaerae]
MKITCRCGAVIPDNTDYLPWKADVIPSQDLSDFFDAEDRVDGLVDNSTTAYQCESCGRLYLEDQSRRTMHCFVPEDADTPYDVLRSVHGEAWRGLVHGIWRQDGGYLSWSAGVESSFEEYTSWEALHRAYDDVFARLRQRDLVRNALLRRDGEDVHTWPAITR